jgi:L-aspartate oxidase
LVFGARAGAAVRRQWRGNRGAKLTLVNSPEPSSSPSAGKRESAATSDAAKIVEAVRAILWDKVGIIRNQEGLTEAVNQLDALSYGNNLPLERKYYEAQNILTVGRLIAASALARHESRGAHYRSDVPFKDNAQPRHSFVSKHTAVYFNEDLSANFAGASAASTSRKASS